MADKKTSKKTSWGNVAEWYHGHLSEGDTYHEKVILPNLRRLLALASKEPVLDIACGEGYFTRMLAESGANIVGADISPELIKIAKEKFPRASFFRAGADDMRFAKDGEFNKAFCVLAFQNIERLDGAIREAARVIKKGGRFVIVLNHPCFRIPKISAWGFDEKKNTQYRRIDGYLSESRAQIDMHPGEKARGKNTPATYSFHRPLQVYMKALAKYGFRLTNLEEWISHRKSQKGPRGAAEDRARKEFPLFLALVVEKI